MRKGMHPQMQSISYVTQSGRLMNVMMTKIHNVGKVYHFRVAARWLRALARSPSLNAATSRTIKKPMISDLESQTNPPLRSRDDLKRASCQQDPKHGPTISNGVVIASISALKTVLPTTSSASSGNIFAVSPPSQHHSRQSPSKTLIPIWMPIKRLASRRPRALRSGAGSEIDGSECSFRAFGSPEHASEERNAELEASSDFRPSLMATDGFLAGAFGGGLRRSSRILEGSSEKRPVRVVDESSGDDFASPVSKKAKVLSESGKSHKNPESVFFVGESVLDEDARSRWPHHYAEKVKKRNGRESLANDDDEDKIILDVKCHYLQADVRGEIFNIGDCAYVKGEKWKPNYIGRILEFFETTDGGLYFTVQWFFRAEDTVLKDQAAFHDKQRVFLSDLKNDNPLVCIVSKVTVARVSPTVEKKRKSIPTCDFYYDMKYSVDYSTFCSMDSDDYQEKSDFSSSNCSGTNNNCNIEEKSSSKHFHQYSKSNKTELALLDLYSGCGGMSTGLCLGAHIAGVNLITRWAVDLDEAASKSLKLNHPETQVRNESADDFFALIKEWEKICKKYGPSRGPNETDVHNSRRKIQDDHAVPKGEYEVLKLVDICYGDPDNLGKRSLKFKVRWKGYGPSEATWEPLEALGNCRECIQDFVQEGLKSKILPLPGDVQVICGGPPCQGITALNRFRNLDAPLDDEKNRQIVVFMDIVQFLKPTYVLMENVVDILRFANGALGRYALSCLVSMHYQARLGIMAAGCYGLPQFRLRTFIWGCHPSEILPQFPLPTHDVIVRCGAPVEFERNLVAYDEGQTSVLEKALVLKDALSDLPAVTNDEVRDQMPYEIAPQTEFQKYLRTPKLDTAVTRCNGADGAQNILYDHCPLSQNEDDYLRICRIPRRKGANFRDLPGIVVNSDKTVRLDPKMKRVLLPSGKPLVPNYALNLWGGRTSRPFGRLWWDETVSTVMTAPDIHYQVVLHPEQDRVLTIRENARLQGFPDYYRFCGTIKERYRQIGNAVAVPVARALGYALALSWLKQCGVEPLMILPPKFSHSHALRGMTSSSLELEDHHLPHLQTTEIVPGDLFPQRNALEDICKQIKQHVGILTRELEGVLLSSDAMASIHRLLAIGNKCFDKTDNAS